MAMLTACHERVLRMLRLLQRLCEHLPSHGADADARQAARDVLRYFDDAAPRHHEDEERHIVPALRALGEDGLASRLLDEHRQMGAAWASLRLPLSELADSGTVPPPTFAGQRAGFDRLYRDHVALEDGRVFPHAAAALDAAALRAMSRDMAERRGLPPPLD
jgi:hemerythrin-like domain-containing protein